jgi:microsomal dipeptidase-like Zn-dependent dipeptidase
MGHMAELQRRLEARYGAADADKICNGNALRVLRAEWGNNRV